MTVDTSNTAIGERNSLLTVLCILNLLFEDRDCLGVRPCVIVFKGITESHQKPSRAAINEWWPGTTSRGQVAWNSASDLGFTVLDGSSRFRPGAGQTYAVHRVRTKRSSDGSPQPAARWDDRANIVQLLSRLAQADYWLNPDQPSSLQIPPTQQITVAQCAICVPPLPGGGTTARKAARLVGRGRRAWLVLVYNSHDPETKKRKYLNQTIHGGLRDAQAHLNKMLGERDRGRNLDSSRQTLNQFLDRWIEVCGKPRLRAKSLRDYEGLLRRYVRPRLGSKLLATVSAFDI